jgi:translocation and assembly module TamB
MKRDMPSPDSDPAAQPRRGVRLGWLAWLVGGGVSVLVAALIGMTLWALNTEPGSTRLLGQLPGVRASGVQGSLLGGDLQAERVEVALPRNGMVTLDGLQWRGLRLERADGNRWLRLRVELLRATRVDVRPGEPGDAAAGAPSDLSLPIELQVESLQVQTLVIAGSGSETLRDLRARVHLGALGGTQHRIDLQGITRDQLRATGRASIGARAPLPLDLALQLAQATPLANAQWSAQATLNGPLAAPRLQATLRAQPAPLPDGKPVPPQSLDLSASLKPFETWPLGDLDARAQALNLQAFLRTAPRTSLSGQARVQSSGAASDAMVTASVRNEEAGAWNAGQLPLRHIDLELRARPDDPGTLDLQRFDAELGTQAQTAGRITGQGRWARSGWQLQAALAELQPGVLDARAAAMRLSGPLRLSGNRPVDTATEATRIDLQAEMTGRALGAPSPNRRASKAPASNAPATDPRGARSAEPGSGPVQLKLDGSWSSLAGAQRFEVREALATAGSARASVAGSVQRAAVAASPWQLRGQATLSQFDPLPWWPGREDSPWRQGPHRLNAKGDFDLIAPVARSTAPTPPPTAAQWLAAWRGRAAVTLRDSVLAGVPLNGEVSLRAADGSMAEAKLDLDAAGNRLRATGRLATRTGATDDRWDATLTAPTLNALTPLWRLLRPGPGAAALTGALQGTFQLEGRWPELVTRGEAQADALRVDTFGVQRADARWRIGTRADAPVEARVTLGDAALGTTTFDNGELKLEGTGRAHRLELRLESKSSPPAWVDGLQGTTSSSASRPSSLATVNAQGGLFDDAAGALAGWRGAIQQLELRSAAAPSVPWLRTRDVAALVRWNDGPLLLELQPGRAELLGAALRWERIAWRAGDARGGPTRIEARAELEPFPLAPLLARLQPDFGWGGDLAVTGRLEVRSAPSFHADVVLERSRGDLTVTDETGTQALGLSDLRLGLNVIDGVWSFTQGLAGTHLGVAAGAVVARTTPEATWPAPQTPVSGVLELQVANLGSWGTWVPAGWRLGGALRVGATIGGTFGALEYTGELTGRELSVRNFLQGVNVTNGDVAIGLEGTRARIERFSARAGNGSVRLAGGATFGAAPQLEIDLTAEQFQLLGRVDRRIVTSGSARVRLDRASLAVDGQLGIDEGLIDFTRSDAPGLSDDVTVVRSAPAGAARAAVDAAAAPKPAGQVSGKAALDLRVDLGQRLRLRGRGIDTGLRGQLHITSPNGRMAVSGSVTTADGTYQAYGQKLVIDRGELVFNGPIENPRLNIEATRPNLDVRAGVAVTGTAVNPRIRLFSEPELSEIDKLSWLVLGRASDGLGRTDTALLQRAALALFAGEGEGEGVTDQLTRALRLDEVSLRQSEGEVRETIVSLGKQLSRRWYVGYERSLNATAGTWQLIYRVAQRFTLRAQSGLDNSLDVIWTWRWQ